MNCTVNESRVVKCRWQNFSLGLFAGSSWSNTARCGWRARSTWRKGECDTNISTEGSKPCIFSKIVQYLSGCQRRQRCFWNQRREGECILLRATHTLTALLTQQHADGMCICCHSRERLVNLEILEKMWVICFHSSVVWLFKYFI